MFYYTVHRYYDHRSNAYRFAMSFSVLDKLGCKHVLFQEPAFITQQEAECYGFDCITMHMPHSCVMVNMDLI